ncbi:globin [Micromonospora sp. WMMA1976]|uniref:globin n=1 Tax=Micromonospora sp. WMMA1976 TaxID=3014995 RepID=UPI00248C2BA0|nr:globin [Micromonospora sp. WMMA1976]WBC04132.1 globin [Micromonospora sp. WMMA1976]
MRTTELVTCPREPGERLGPVAVRAAVLTARLGAALGGTRRSPDGVPADAGTPVLGGPRRPPLTGEQRWRVLDYLAAALWTLDLPAATVVDAQRAVAGLLRA